ncbi:S4 domain-containing protein [Vreelandella populi]
MCRKQWGNKPLHHSEPSQRDQPVSQRISSKRQARELIDQNAVRINGGCAKQGPLS